MSANAFRLAHTSELMARINAERLDAAEQEFLRADRMRQATVQVLVGAARELDELLAQPFAIKPEDLRVVAGTMAGVIELLKGEWIRSPQQMAHERKG